MKKLLASLLSVALCLGLAVPAMAAAPQKPGGNNSYCRIEVSNYVWNAKDIFDLYQFTPADAEGIDDYGHFYENTTDGCYHINPRAAFRITNTAPQGTNCLVYVRMYAYQWKEELWQKEGEPTFDAYGADSMTYSPLTEDGFVNGEYFWNSDVLVELYPGESYTFQLKTRYWDEPTSDSSRYRMREDRELIYMIVYLEYPGEGTEADTSRYECLEDYYMIDSAVPEGELPDSIPPKNPTDVTVRFSNGTQNDAGVSYDYKLTNTTGETINGYYALLSYSPSYNTVRGGVSAQLHTFDVTLKPGESAAGTLNSNFWELSRHKLIWIQFDDKADRDAFLSNRALVGDFGRYVVDSDRGAQWLKDNFDITLNPAK